MSSDQSAGATKRVLLVEDDPTIRRAMTRLLEHEGFAVDAAGTLSQASAMLDGQPGVVLDLNLPDGLGTELLARIRSEHGRKVVVVIASGSDPDTIEDARRFNPDCVLLKPVDVAALLRCLREGR